MALAQRVTPTCFWDQLRGALTSGQLRHAVIGALNCRDSISVEQQMLAAVVQLVTRGADTQRSSFVIEEVFDAEELRLLRKELSLPSTLERSLFSVPLLVSTSSSERWIAPTIVTVCNVCIGTSPLDRRQYRSTVKAAIRRHLHLREQVLAGVEHTEGLSCSLQQWREQVRLVP